MIQLKCPDDWDTVPIILTFVQCNGEGGCNAMQPAVGPICTGTRPTVGHHYKCKTSCQYHCVCVCVYNANSQQVATSTC